MMSEKSNTFSSFFGALCGAIIGIAIVGLITTKDQKKKAVTEDNSEDSQKENASTLI
jgi:hypothetical protein